MPSRQVFSRVLLVVFSILGLLVVQPAKTSAATSPAANDEGMEVMTRGPIHEAFADVSANEAKPAVVINGSVPEPVKEVPPDYRPEGDNVQWISGYWSWDDDQNDFIWVSGIWRDIPPGRQWIPGYWMTVSGGNQFVSGYWTDIEQTETVYLPPPPQPLQAVAGTPDSSPDTLWIDGHWLWSGDGYAWQAGYWLRQRPDMIWIPSHYVWTPRGYVFVRGYWDYQFGRRGVLFAPRHYPRPIYRSHDYYYTPTIVLNIDTIFLSLFIRRDHHHYYFGDYHDVRYERRGYLPWYSRHATRYGYDPCYRSYRWHHMRDDRQWEHNYHQQYQHRRDHREARPPVFYRSQRDNNYDRSHGFQDRVLGRPLAEVVDKRDQAVRFTRLNQEHRREFQNRERRLADFQNERRRVEIEPDKEGRPRRGGDIKRPERVRRPDSPIVDRSGRDNISGNRPGKDQDNRRGNPQQRTNDRLQGEQQEVNQPAGTDNLSNDQAQPVKPSRRQRQEVEGQPDGQSQVKPTRRQLQEAEGQPDGQSQVKPTRRVPQRRADQPEDSQSQGYRQESQPIQVDGQNLDQPRGQRQRGRNTEVEGQPDTQPQPRVKPPQRVLPQAGENQPDSGPQQGYRQQNQPRNLDSQESVQSQRGQQRRQPMAVEQQQESKPQMRQPRRSPQRMEDSQGGGQPQVNQQRREPQRERVQRQPESQPQVRQQRRQQQRTNEQKGDQPQPQNKQRGKRLPLPEEQVQEPAPGAEQPQGEEQGGARRQ